MRIENVEIYSDQSSMPVVRHPGRKFPGLLVQGDTLHALCVQTAVALSDSPDAVDELRDLHGTLLAMLEHYKSVLDEHQISLPFVETPDA